METQDGQRELPLKMSFPCAITFPNPGRRWKEGETIIALYAYRLRGGHWRMDCCVKGRAGVPEGQLRRWAALAVTGVRGWGDRVEEHMSYSWLQVFTRAPQAFGGGPSGGRGCGGGGEEEGDDASSTGGRPGPVLVCDTPQPPPPPRVLKDSGAGSATSKCS